MPKVTQQIRGRAGISAQSSAMAGNPTSLVWIPLTLTRVVGLLRMIHVVEQADAVASALEGQVVEVASRLYSLRCLGQGTQEPSQGSDPITAVWQVTGVGTAPGMKVSSANLPVANKTDTQ